jgi:hypothetical protein
MTKSTINFKGKVAQLQDFSDEGVPANVVICKTSSGQRFARVAYFGRLTRKGVARIPLELLALSAGQDAWMRGIQFKCAGCGAVLAASEMEGEYCPACNEKALQENAVLDGVEAA